MKVQIKKIGNSAALHLPSNILKQLHLSIGEELSISMTDNGMLFEKVAKPREGWFNGINQASAKSDAKKWKMTSVILRKKP
ncbi:hypothetical protein L0B53_12055 [Vibrio sp. SS-MA-C1-2]|uniref:AbrB/MazE/SpoVT family DNA-binding domain-containing protein n=1 Tax=Vibrio sp. SS-MA-C1-2 TaxID=2908646 RepID=UPI001F1C01C6|nr:hypothetical protein [Vibrio sp. SS-MA-C1-2]UJF17762.1 hypothetical protein L0B53_12055 [Vibrio sp. SS-MA-C1-2]